MCVKAVALSRFELEIAITSLSLQVIYSISYLFVPIFETCFGFVWHKIVIPAYRSERSGVRLTEEVPLNKDSEVQGLETGEIASSVEKKKAVYVLKSYFGFQLYSLHDHQWDFPLLTVWMSVLQH